jgi:hypothetical protein
VDPCCRSIGIGAVTVFIRRCSKSSRAHTQTHTHIPLHRHHLSSPHIQPWLPTSRQLQANCRPVLIRSRADRVSVHRTVSMFTKANFSIAEQTLKTQETSPGFSLALLQIVNTDSFPQATRLAAALFFKNFIRRNWVVSG